MNGFVRNLAGAIEVHREGPWPFVTYRAYRLRDRKFIWRARQHRKGLVHLPGQKDTTFWHRPAYNWFMGLSFAIGAALFMIGAVLALVTTSLPGTQIGTVFFSGSIPFTLAGFLQHFQAANTPEFSELADVAPAPEKLRLIGWQPTNSGWWCTLTQFVGTVAFNFNTFDAIDAPSGQVIQDLIIWVPGMIGSILFLVSGYLAYIETGHAYWSFRPRQLDWWITFINLIGCITFMASSLLAYVPAGEEPGWILPASNINLLIGAACFFAGAILLMFEARKDWEKEAYEVGPAAMSDD
ncbi:hypothetical protein [Labrenzia sp. 011]|uniref:hypothetical protein n=1 Tax=Labrenzia sp. 011 TaxID=2171494 RepID=UPI000D511E5D|nr:hypothetical protein [Labrenzia sp. 011]PVB60467.1 hypothetical protein DCO57_16850 [Labrenzia sp. 011]